MLLEDLHTHDPLHMGELPTIVYTVEIFRICKPLNLSPSMLAYDQRDHVGKVQLPLLIVGDQVR